MFAKLAEGGLEVTILKKAEAKAKKRIAVESGERVELGAPARAFVLCFLGEGGAVRGVGGLGGLGGVAEEGGRTGGHPEMRGPILPFSFITVSLLTWWSHSIPSCSRGRKYRAFQKNLRVHEGEGERGAERGRAKEGCGTRVGRGVFLILSLSP